MSSSAANLLGRVRGSSQVGRKDHLGLQCRQLLGRASGLRQTNLVEGDIGLALETPRVVPLRATVSPENDAPPFDTRLELNAQRDTSTVSSSGMVGQSLHKRSSE